MDPPTVILPPVTALSPSLIVFLNSTFNSNGDLDLSSESNRLVSDLESRCDQLNLRLSDLTLKLRRNLDSYDSFSDRIGGEFVRVKDQIREFQSDSASFASSSDGDKAGERGQHMVAEELPALAKEVARVEAVRNYAETALKLNSLIGEIEDAVSSVMNKNLRRQAITQNSQELLLNPISSLKLTEDILTSVAECHPQWVRLVSAADHRVDRALAILRPQAIADHRALLTSLGWPPPLSTLNSSNVEKRSTEIANPLSTMHGELKQKYRENFIALCGLQELQRRRKSRQLKGYDRHIALYPPLWTIEELVNPLFVVCQHHFEKWIDKPEFIFALVYKIIRDYVDSMDELLQPLVDEAMITGYSCREEWISAMVTSLTTYLAKDVFPEYVSQLDEERTNEVRLQAKMSWLHLIDLMISFDKRVKSLVVNSGISVSLEEDENLQRISCLSVFCDRPDWLNTWAEIELGTISEKLKLEMEDERNWTMKLHSSVILPGSEDFKSPLISSIFLRNLSSVIDRSRSLPTMPLRSEFIKLLGVPMTRDFLHFLLTRCLEAEGLTALADDDALSKVATCINAARHLESFLKEWSEDVFFLEMGSDGILDEETEKVGEFLTEWVGKITTVLMRGFDAQSREYIKNKKQWQEKNIEEGWTVTKSFLGALDYLQGKISVIEKGLNDIDFTTVWRSLAAGLDRLLFNGVFLGNAKFNEGGVERFGSDMGVLFGLFKSWCMRPEGFFPYVNEAMRILKMEEKCIRRSYVEGEKWRKENGIRHLSKAEAERVVKCKLFVL